MSQVIRGSGYMTTAKKLARKQSGQKRARAQSATRKRIAAQSHGSNTPGFANVASTPMQLSMVPSTVRSVHVISPFPAKKRVTLRYADKYQILDGDATQELWNFRVNSCFDPDLTGTGHRPRFFTTFCSATGPYTYYRVLGVRVTVEAYASADNNAQPVIVSCGFNQAAGAPTNPTGSVVANPYPTAEIPGCTTALLSPYARSTKFNFQRTIADILGATSKAVEAEDDYRALYNANPANIAYFFISAMNGEDSGGVSSCTVGFSMEMDVQFEEYLAQPYD